MDKIHAQHALYVAMEELLDTVSDGRAMHARENPGTVLTKKQTMPEQACRVTDVVAASQRRVPAVTLQ